MTTALGEAHGLSGITTDGPGELLSGSSQREFVWGSGSGFSAETFRVCSSSLDSTFRPAPVWIFDYEGDQLGQLSHQASTSTLR
jgi:hypothetical protein